MRVGSVMTLFGDMGCQSLLSQGVKIAKSKALIFLLKNALICLTNFSPNRIFYYYFEIHF